MTNGHPGAGGPFDDDRDDPAPRAGPGRRGDVWGPPPRQPGRPDPAGNGLRQPGRAPGQFGQPPARPFGQPAPGPFGQPASGQSAARPPGQPPTGPGTGAFPPGRPGGYPRGVPDGHPVAGTGPIPLVDPGAQAPGPGLGTGGFGYDRPGSSPWGGAHAAPRAGGVPPQDRYPPVGGYQPGHAAPAGRRGWQDPPGDVWARPGDGPDGPSWSDSPARMGRDPDDALFATQPGSTRALRQRIAATGGARVRRVWPQRLAVGLLIAAALVVCWYWVFPWLENILPSEF